MAASVWQTPNSGRFAVRSTAMGAPSPRKSRRARRNRQGERMSDNHQHAEAPASRQQRRPSPETIINGLNASLNERASEIRTLQDQLVYQHALVADLEAENTGLTAALDQITAENRMLRARCGLPEAGAIELTDDEAAVLPAEMVTETPEPGDAVAPVEGSADHDGTDS